MATLLHNNLGKLAKLTDVHRFALAGINLETNGDEYTVTATNGKVLASITGTAGNFDSEYPAISALDTAPNGETSSLILGKEFAAAMKDAPHKSGLKPVLRTVAVVVGEKVTTLASTNLETQSVRQATNMEGRYPDYRGVYPSGTPAVTLRLTIEYLRSLLTVAEDISADGTVEVKVYAKDKPIEVVAQNTEQKMRGLVMPHC